MKNIDVCWNLLFNGKDRLWFYVKNSGILMEYWSGLVFWSLNGDWWSVLGFDMNFAVTTDIYQTLTSVTHSFTFPH